MMFSFVYAHLSNCCVSFKDCFFFTSNFPSEISDLYA